jgi:hypothetical protein
MGDADTEWFDLYLGPHPAHVCCAYQSGSRIVFATSGAVFQTNGRFEHIPFLAHALDACAAIDTTDNIILYGYQTSTS